MVRVHRVALLLETSTEYGRGLLRGTLNMLACTGHGRSTSAPATSSKFCQKPGRGKETALSRGSIRPGWPS